MKRGKIALLGNMNNNFSVLSRFLIDQGYDVTLFMFDYEVEPHFHPSADSYDDRWETYTRQLSWGGARGFPKLSKKYLSKFFSDYQVLIGSGLAPAAAHKAGRILDLFIPHGADLNHLPYLEEFNAKALARHFFAGLHQRAGIRDAKFILTPRWPEEQEVLIRKLGIRGKRIFSSIPFLYSPQYVDHRPDLSQPQIRKVASQRETTDLLVFHHIRHKWVDDVEPKGNDIFFHGVANFRKRNPGVRMTIITFEYGSDVEQSKRLIQNLDLTNVVHWFPVSNRNVIMSMMQFADIVTGEMKESYLSYSAIAEGMLTGIPIMHKRIDALYQDQYDMLYPMINASTVEEVAAGLEWAAKHPDERRLMGSEGRLWAKEHFIDTPLKTVTNLLGQM